MVSPIVALMKQARAYGVGCVLATQNPMDLDYRALGNAGLWCLGRLTTDADRERLVEALGGVRGAQPPTERMPAPAALGDVVSARANDAQRDSQGGGGGVRAVRWRGHALRATE